MSFDVIIPLGPKDEDMISVCVASIKRHIVGVRKIFVVAYKPIDVSGATVISEDIFPFTRADVEAVVEPSRGGWYLQQLIKLYGPLVIPGVLDNCLVVDADGVFFRRVKFIEQGVFLMDMNREEPHKPYFDHMLALHPTFQAWKPLTSGIVNVMIYNKAILLELMKKVEDHHKDIFWKIFLAKLPKGTISAASEYEIYFHYIMRNHPNKAKLRPLQYYNFGQRSNMDGAGDWHYVNYHWHVQKKPRR